MPSCACISPICLRCGAGGRPHLPPNATRVGDGVVNRRTRELRSIGQLTQQNRTPALVEMAACRGKSQGMPGSRQATAATPPRTAPWPPPASPPSRWSGCPPSGPRIPSPTRTTADPQACLPRRPHRSGLPACHRRGSSSPAGPHRPGSDRRSGAVTGISAAFSQLKDQSVTRIHGARSLNDPCRTIFAPGKGMMGASPGSARSTHSLPAFGRSHCAISNTS
jgi:hypothetical protein